MADCRWLKPVLVGQFEFLEWTGDNHLRHTKFVALREDKDPKTGRSRMTPRNQMASVSPGVGAIEHAGIEPNHERLDHLSTTTSQAAPFHVASTARAILGDEEGWAPSRGRLYPHDLGFELRIVDERGDFVFTKVTRSEADAVNFAAGQQDLYRAKGWQAFRQSSGELPEL